tara:strand:+ start:146 stop:319 length:174 start_codon:yes stop_codon:yes gene_type:complete
MNAIEHKDCFGTILPKHVGLGKHAGKVLTLIIEPPQPFMQARPQIETDIQQWDDCQQ